MHLVCGYKPMDPEPGRGGGGKPAPTGSGDDPKPAEGGSDKGGSLLDGEDPKPGDGGEPKPDEGGQGGASLLDDDGKPKDGEEPKPGEGQEPKPPTEEQIAEWCKGCPALDLGDGVQFDDAALLAMAPTLMGLKKDESDKVIKAYAEYTKAQIKANAEAQDAFNRGLVEECNKRFGADLKKVVSYAKKGGEAFFGDKVWKVMKGIPSFANNPDVMERLAEYGRKMSTDSGKVVPKDGNGGGEDGDVLHRMYGGVKV